MRHQFPEEKALRLFFFLCRVGGISLGGEEGRRAEGSRQRHLREQRLR